MSLYRLDYATPTGQILAPVKDRIMTSSDYLSRHAQTARRHAIELSTAEGEDRCILITRIGKSGQTKPTMLVLPGGRVVYTDGRGRPASGGRR